LNSNIKMNMSDQSEQVRILQFGTGVFLKGFVGDFITRANEGATEKAKIVVVKSTGEGTAPTGPEPYYLRKRGLEAGHKQSIISRIDVIAQTLHSNCSWNKILNYGRSVDLRVVISNTTELGLSYVEETLTDVAPKSYPAKLTKILAERFISIGDTEESGLIVLPCELLVDNGGLLKTAVMKVASHNGLGKDFIEWLERRVRFCSTLVDRIVTGAASKEEASTLNIENGTEGLPLIDAELYALWAIEGDAKLESDLWFGPANRGTVVVAENISIYRELKLRLLNGTHTLMTPVCLLAGHKIVAEAMTDTQIIAFVKSAMVEGLMPLMDEPESKKQEFGQAVLDRFANPFIAHELHKIAAQSTLKIKNRILPLVEKALANGLAIDQSIIAGIGAWLALAKVTKEKNGKFYTSLHGEDFEIVDEKAGAYAEICKKAANEEIALKDIISSAELWGERLGAMQNLETRLIGSSVVNL
jgi:tagaturonate reductase